MKQLMRLPPTGDLLSAGDATHVPPLLRHAHAVCSHSTQGAAELNGTQIEQLDGSLYEGICTQCCCQTQGTVFNGRG